jgi:hypothetical protein
MAHCAITPEGHIALLKKVVLFVKYNMSKGQPIDVKQLTQQFYDGLLTTFTKKHANAELAEIQALDYARFVPDYIHKIAAQDSEVLEYLIKSGVDFNTLSVDLLKLKNDATLTEIKNYLNTQDDINTVLTALNKGVSINAGPLEDEEDTLGKGEGIEDSSEAVKDIEKL